MRRPRGPDRQPRKRRLPPSDDVSFGWGSEAEAAEDESVPPKVYGEQPSEPPPEIIALGLPPADAAGIQKWNYQLLSTFAALAARDNTIGPETRLNRVAKLTQAAARHYPEAAKFDLMQKIERDAAELVGRKKAKAAAKLERATPGPSAKVIPIRPDAEVR